ncbi:TPA: hypothetical protein ACS7ZY_002024 [Providencia alcalifaciens]
MNLSSLNHLSLVPTRKEKRTVHDKRSIHDSKSTDFAKNPMSNSVAMMMIYHPYPLRKTDTDVTNLWRK